VITIDLGIDEYFDGKTNQFHYDEGGVVRFEYTLKTIYDWEAKWKKPFLKGSHTHKEMVDFYMMMALDPIKERFITDEVMETLSNYLKDPQTATTFSSEQNSQNGNKTTSKAKLHTAEEIYAIMALNGIPLEFENRNFNRLLTIMRVISAYNEPPKKMSPADVRKQNAELNAMRRKQLNSKG